MRFPHLAILVLSGALAGCAQDGSTRRDHTGPERAPAMAYLAHSDGHWQVFVADEGGENARVLTRSPVDKVSLSWFPDGRALLVNDQDGHLVRVDFPRGKETRLSFPFEGMRDARLSPDGNWVAFSHARSDSPDTHSVWVCGLDGSNARRLTHRERLQQAPAWDPTSTWVYYLSSLGPGQGYDLWRVGIDGANDERLSFGGAYRLDVAVGRDGTLVYSGNESGSYDLWIKAPGANPTPLTDDPAVDAHPVFTPEEDSLLFESTRSGTLNVWRIARSGGAAAQVTRHDGAGARFPVPRPAGALP